MATSKPSQPWHCRNSPGVTETALVLPATSLSSLPACCSQTWGVETAQIGFFSKSTYWGAAPGAACRLQSLVVLTSPYITLHHPVLPPCWHLWLRCPSLAWLPRVPARCREWDKTRCRETQPARKGNHACSGKELIKICADKATGSATREGVSFGSGRR